MHASLHIDGYEKPESSKSRRKVLPRSPVLGRKRQEVRGLKYGGLLAEVYIVMEYIIKGKEPLSAVPK
ncbi:MAG: hypothetical protein QXL27_08655 [Candidatus Bathyarchaeia archaeon]